MDKVKTRQVKAFGASRAVAFGKLMQLLELLEMNQYIKFCAIDDGRAGAEADTMRYRAFGTIGSYELSGEIVVKCYDGVWRLYCAASYVELGEDQWTIWHDHERNEIGVRIGTVNGPFTEERVYQGATLIRTSMLGE